MTTDDRDRAADGQPQPGAERPAGAGSTANDAGMSHPQAVVPARDESSVMAPPAGDPDRDDPDVPRPMPPGGSTWLVLAFAALSAACLGWGLVRLALRPDLPLDFLLLFGAAAVLARQAWALAVRYGVTGRGLDAAVRGVWARWLPGERPASPGEMGSGLAGATGEPPGEGAGAAAGGGLGPATAGAWSSPAAPTPEPAYVRPAAWAASPRPAVVMLAGLAAALAGQILLDTAQTLTLAAVALMTAAVAAWLWALARTPEAVDDAPVAVVAGPGFDAGRARALGIGLALVTIPALMAPLLGATARAWLGLLDYPPVDAVDVRLMGTNTFTRLGGTMWLAGIAAYVYALADRSGWAGGRRWLARRPGITLRIGPTGLALGAIAAVAAWYRFHDLARLPFEMTSDHTEKLLDIASIVDGLRPVFMPANSGREAMQFYWIAFLVALGLPLTFMTLKVGMSIIGTLTVGPLYRLGRRIGGAHVGLMSALILAILPWHIQITRIALRISLAPLWISLTFIALFRALAHGRRNDWLWVGLATGLGMYSYSAFRPMLFVVPLVVVLKLVHDAWHGRREGFSRDLAAHGAAAAGLTALLVVPLVRYGIDRPGEIGERTATRIFGDAFSTQPTAVWDFLRAQDAPFFFGLLRPFGVNLRNALLMFNVTSDNAWFQSPPGRPAFETVGGALFVLGLAVALHRIRRRDWQVGTLVVTMPILLLSTIMALAFPNENPSLTRASAALPAAVVIAALPLPALLGRMRAAWGPRTAYPAYAVLVVVLVAWMARGTDARYFGEYRYHYDESTHPTSEGAAVIRSFVNLGGDLDHVYYAAWSNGWDHRLLGIQVGKPDWTGILWPADGDWDNAIQQARGHVADPSRKLYLVGGPLAAQHIAFLKSLYPSALVTVHHTRVPGKDFWSILVPERAAPPTEQPPE